MASSILPQSTFSFVEKRVVRGARPFVDGQECPSYQPIESSEGRRSGRDDTVVKLGSAGASPTRCILTNETMGFSLSLFPEPFAICRLGAHDAIPDWASGDFVSVTRTGDELSVICRQNGVPEEITSDRDWRCLQLCGPLELTEIGVLASLAAILAEARISVLVVGTYDTDYLLVKSRQLERTLAALAQAGHRVQDGR